jgi:hypothetical protein
MKKLIYPFTFKEWKKANPEALKWCKKISDEIKYGEQLKINL